MAKQKITAESRLRTENISLKEDNMTLDKELGHMHREIAGRDAALAEVQHQLAVSERSRLLAEERLSSFRTASMVQTRLLADLQNQTEMLRFPEPKRG